MAASGFTPIILFNSGTASNVPTTGNLAVGELAINYADGKLYYNTGSAIKVLAGSGGAGVVAGSNTQVQYNNSGVFGASASFTFDGTTLTAPSNTFNTATTGSTNKGPLNYGTLNFSDTGIVQSSQTSVNSYFQNVIQNTSSGTQASAEFIVYNDQGTATTNYATVGINSSGYSGTGSINAAGYGFFVTASTDLVLGTIGANGIHFTTNSSATDALAISSAGAVSFPGGTANGVAYLNGSKVLTTGSALTFDGTNLSLSSGNIFVPTTSGVFFSSPGTFVNGVYGVGTNNVAFNANNAEQMRLTSTGLRLGTTSSLGVSDKLTVVGGNLAVQRTSGITTILGDNTQRGYVGTTSNTTLSFLTNSTEQMYLDSSGNLGLGVTPSAWSTLTGFDINTWGAVSAYTNQINVSSNAYYNGGWKYKQTNYATRYEQNSTGIHAWFTAPSGTAGNAISFTQAMTLDNSGNLGVGTTSPSSFGKLAIGGSTGTVYVPTNGVQLAFSYGGANYISTTTAGGSLVFQTGASSTAATIDSSGNLLVGQTATGYQNSNSAYIGGGSQIFSHYNTSTGTTYIGFGYNQSQIGSITQSGTTAVLYNTTSDQRLKENIVDAPEFGSVIDSIQVRSYDWKADHTHQRAGFIAQELVNVAPEAVHQPADPEEMMAVDYSKLVPMLVKEIQDLRARLKAANIA